MKTLFNGILTAIGFKPASGKPDKPVQCEPKFTPTGRVSVHNESENYVAIYPYNKDARGTSDVFIELENARMAGLRPVFTAYDFLICEKTSEWKGGQP